MVTDSILIRVQRLLALANNNTNVNEAASAAAKAQQLIEEYNLDMAQIAADKGESTISDEEISRDHEPLYQGKNAITWKASLADCIAKANNCRVFLMGGNIHIVGKPTGVSLSRYLFNYVSNEIDRLCNMAIKTAGGYGGKSYGNNFRLGAVQAIRDNLRISQLEVRKQYVGTQAMVIINQESEMVDNWLAENMRLRTKAPVRTSYNGSARSDGYAAGKSINLNRGALNGNSGTRLLK